MRYALLIVLSGVFALQACSPEPVYRLKVQGDNEQTSFYKGVEYIQLEQDSVLLTLSYYEHTADLFSLDVEITNHSNEVIRVEPSDFSYFSFLEKESELREALSFNHAKDPEREVLEIELALSEQKAKKKTSEFFHYTSQSLTLAEGLNADSYKEWEETENKLVRNEVSQEIDREKFRYNQMNLKERKEIWQLDALRITDLWPGEQIRGLVFFKTTPDAHFYKIKAEIEESEFEIWFRQKKYDP